MKQFYINSIIEDNIVIIYVKGHLDAHNTSRFEKELLWYLEKGFFRILLDCYNLNYITSAGMGIIMGYGDEIRERGGDIVLIGCNEKIYETLDLVGFTDIYKFYNDSKSAKGYLINLKPKINKCMTIESVLKSLGIPKRIEQRGNILVMQYTHFTLQFVNNKLIKKELQLKS